MTDIIKLVCVEVLLLLSATLGDFMLQHPIAKQRIVIAFGDSLTHGVIGGLSWAVVCDVKMRRRELFECAICTILSMLVDLDHFIAARSFKLEAALSLPRRPPLHATTVILLVNIVLLSLASVFSSANLVIGAAMFTTAWFSHHIRDGYRRGLWFYPFGETAPLSRTVYLTIIIIFPVILHYVLYFCLNKRYKERVISLDSVELG